MENRNSLQPIRTAAPADRLLGRVCSVGGPPLPRLRIRSADRRLRRGRGALRRRSLRRGGDRRRGNPLARRGLAAAGRAAIVRPAHRLDPRTYDTRSRTGRGGRGAAAKRTDRPRPFGPTLPGLRPGQQLPFHAQPEELHGRAPLPAAGGRADRSAMLGLYGFQPTENQCRRTGLPESGASRSRRGRGRRMFRCLCQPGGRFRPVRLLRRKRRTDPQKVASELRRAFPQRRDRRRLPPRHENPGEAPFENPRRAVGPAPVHVRPRNGRRPGRLRLADARCRGHGHGPCQQRHPQRTLRTLSRRGPHRRQELDPQLRGTLPQRDLPPEPAVAGEDDQTQRPSSAISCSSCSTKRSITGWRKATSSAAKSPRRKSRPRPRSEPRSTNAPARSTSTRRSCPTR